MLWSVESPAYPVNSIQMRKARIMNRIAWPKACVNDPLLWFSLPFVGKIARFKRSVKTELRNRSREEWLKEWMSCSIEWRETSLFLRIVVRLSYVNWPNEFVIPDDTAGIIMGYLGDSEMDSEDVLWPLLSLYGIKSDSYTAELIDKAVFIQHCTIRKLWEMIYANWH